MQQVSERFKFDSREVKGGGAITRNRSSNVNALNAGIEKPLTNDPQSRDQRPGANFKFIQKRPVPAPCKDRSQVAIWCITSAAKCLETAAEPPVFGQGKAEASSRFSGGNSIRMFAKSPPNGSNPTARSNLNAAHAMGLLF
jgi:hypothetical protein